MINRVRVRYFKLFDDEIFDLSDVIVLAGPNNMGKTTLLQAVATWNLAFQKWLAKRGLGSKSRTRKRTAVAITRKEFAAIPLRELNLLWTNRSTALKKHELQKGQKLGVPRILEVTLEIQTKNGSLSVGFEFRYHNPEMLYAGPTDATLLEDNLDSLKDFQVAHVPPFSGIGTEETRYDRAYQDLLVGQGKPGDILRNLLLEIYDKSNNDWTELLGEIEEVFGYRLQPPEYEGRPFILCEYLPGVPSGKGLGGYPKLDISCAGSGFLQVLTLLAFIYARPASVLLLDEPDAHQHVVLQKMIYDWLRQTARRRGCQLLIATHSGIIVDGTAPERILSFLDHPHILLTATERNQVHEALKRLTNTDLLLAKQAQGILYVEGETDLDLLREWARVMGHATYEFLGKRPFWHSNEGRNPGEAKAHFFALKAVKANIRGILLLDGDNRRLPDHEIAGEGLAIARWRRYEVENYLIHPDALRRFVEGQHADLATKAQAAAGIEYLRNELPPAILRNPLGDHDYLDRTPASKTLLPGFFSAAGLALTKKEYYQVAAQMLPEEIHPEIREKLDLTGSHLGLC